MEIAAALEDDSSEGSEPYRLRPMRYGGFVNTMSWFDDLSQIDWTKYDVVQISDLCLPGNLQALLRIPASMPILLYQGHYWEPSGFNRWLRLAWTRLAAAALSRRRRYSVLVKNEGAGEMLAAYGLRNPRVVGVGLQAARLLTPEPLPPAMEDFLATHSCPLLYVGAVDSRRPVRWVLRHLRDEALASAGAIVVGKGTDEAGLQAEFADLVQAGRLLFVQSLTQGQLGNLYRRIGLLVLPTNFEIYGMVCLEGVLFDLPVLASDVPGPRTIARRFPGSVTLIPTGESPEAWRSALIKAMSAVHGRPDRPAPTPANIDKLSWRAQGEVFAAAIKDLTGGPADE
ncbi:MAG: glycosyltransferase [Chthoniobacter sp.]|uniref:glycosyltransferase n=1 Tax=Chthoniobacter sp. TaxID=2510640 RepID=UPI0032A66E53